MKTYVSRLLVLILVFILLLVGMNIAARKLISKKNTERNVVVDRINAEIGAAYDDLMFNVTSGVPPTPTEIYPDDIEEQVFYSRKDEWSSLYGAEACPEDVEIIPFKYLSGFGIDESSNVDEKSRPYIDEAEIGGDGTVVRGLYYFGVVNGLVEYTFDDSHYDRLLILMNAAVIVAAVITLIFSLWILRKIIIPFNKISDYPERLSKGELTEKLPEKKDKFFGRYVWGMNMLSDKLEHDRKTIQKMETDHQKFVTVLVHGIKTPAMNIKLLSEAIATGLYDPEGKVNEKDAELARKIEEKADEIELRVTEAVDETNTAIFEYNPDAKSFYRDEIEKFIREEYTNTFKVGRIPFTVKAEGNPIVKSDMDGIRRILRQIMDNAIKYGDGKGITLKMEKQEEGHFISVINSGEPLPDSELPFVFNSLWRGSNSKNVNGSGVGLYEARVIARKLGGEIRMQARDGETEVTLFLP